MRIRHLAPLAAVLLSSTAAAHGPSTGAMLPHAHPHSAEGFSGWEALLLGVFVAVVAIGVWAIARRRAGR